jgi:hypothetical protein
MWPLPCLSLGDTSASGIVMLALPCLADGDPQQKGSHGQEAAAQAMAVPASMTHSNEQDRRDRLSATVEADQEAFELATVQYKAGLSDFLAVLDAQREMYANQDLLARSRTQVTTNLIGLYRALGGGWSISPEIGVDTQ